MAEQERPNGDGESRFEQQAGAAAAALGDSMDEAMGYVKQQWRENPLAVAAVVAGIGFLLGVLFKGSRG